MGILAGLAQASLPVQSGQLAGQIAGKQMQIGYGLQIANAMREQQLAQAQVARDQAMADMYSGKNPTALWLQQLKNTGAETVQGQKSVTAEQLAASTNEIKQQLADQLGKYQSAQSDVARMLAGTRAQALQAQLERQNAILGNSYVSQFLNTHKDDIASMKTFSDADAAVQQLKAGNPAAYRAALAGYARNEAGGTLRKAIIDYTTSLNPSLAGKIQTEADALSGNLLPDSQLAGMANVIAAQHRNVANHYAAGFTAELQAHPGAESSFAPFAPNVMMDVPGNPSGMGVNATPASAPATGQYSSWNTLPKPSAGVTAPAVAAPKLPLAAGAAATPNPSSPQGTSN